MSVEEAEMMGATQLRQNAAVRLQQKTFTFVLRSISDLRFTAALLLPSLALLLAIVLSYRLVDVTLFPLNLRPFCCSVSQSHT